ncbi:exopolysaccharide biosynthesis polyprenyl glycosylphosphotransferase [Roseomonas sp. CAU 1739]|uniref:exopolysaccharide biosynthesis polyprenyl glycosylphosphotransferase n=1 Tax=Roseomonas sp. CAU 1739 TaxID=3140364 RepID=UPI00325A772F
MKSHVGRNQHPGLAILIVMDFAAAFVAGIVLSGGRMNGADLMAVNHSALSAAAIGVVFVTVLAACGLYQAQAWFAARRLAGRSIMAMLLLTLGTALVVTVVGNAPPASQMSFWSIPALYVALVATMRLGLASALGSWLVRPRLAWIDAAGLHPATPFDHVHTVLGIAPHERPIALQDGAGQTAGRAVKELRRNGIRAAVATDPDAVTPALRGACAEAGVRVMSACEFRELQQGRVDLDILPEAWLDATPLAREGAVTAALRRGFDIVGSLALLTMTLPLLLLTALAIRIEGAGPIFYRQERVGLNGRVFRLFKFRSMSVDAEAGGPRWAVARDPRVTRVGRLIRLTRIDEIPQAINVLRGDMALIGPRPERPNFVEHLGAVIPHYHSRSAVRPGITGWAQINYPYGASVEDARNKLSYDLYYLRHRSIGLDIAIILGTIRVVLLQEGAR